MKYILVLIYLFLTTAGLFCMKKGTTAPTIEMSKDLIFKIGPLNALGFILYIFSFLLWQKLVSLYDLSFIVPLSMGIIQVLVLLLGYFYFKENITKLNLVGIILIIIGIVLISIKK